MTIWSQPSEETQAIPLVRWRIIQDETGACFFLGFDEHGQEGRVSSRVIDFDPDHLNGVTERGEFYQLVGDSGRDWDADDALATWCALRMTTIDDYRMIDPDDLSLREITQFSPAPSMMR